MLKCAETIPSLYVSYLTVRTIKLYSQQLVIVGRADPESSSTHSEIILVSARVELEAWLSVA